MATISVQLSMSLDGFIARPDDAPGPIFETTEALAESIRAGEHDLERVRAFARASFDVADGRATARLVDRVLLPALDGRTVTPRELERALRAEAGTGELPSR